MPRNNVGITKLNIHLYEVDAGVNRFWAVRDLVAAANETQTECWAEFNGVWLKARPGDTTDNVNLRFERGQ